MEGSSTSATSTQSERALQKSPPTFKVPTPNISSFNATEEIYPGYPGMVVRADGDELRLDAITWGFSPVILSKKTGKPLKPKPVNNARDDKLAPLLAVGIRAPALPDPSNAMGGG